MFCNFLVVNVIIHATMYRGDRGSRKVLSGHMGQVEGWGILQKTPLSGGGMDIFLDLHILENKHGR